nr:carotenoid 1,2-hydratase [Candidatus Eremiobacteraeota bacterium]
MNRWLAALGALLLAALPFAVAAARAQRSADGFLEAVAPYRYSFPRDHAAHDAYRTEWWYFTGHLQARDGHRFGYELTFFRVGLAPHAADRRPGSSRWHGTQLSPAHFAITDERTGRFVFYENFARDALGQSRASEARLDVRVHSWSLRGPMPFKLHAASGSDAIDLTVRSKKPPAIHGQGGISRKGPCASCASHYYSYTRLVTTGEIRVQGRPYRVRGTSWMDHEFGSDELQPDQVGWDWFSIQLNDGREIMVYRLRRKDGSTTPQSSGSLIEKNGAVRFLPLRDFAIHENRTWISPHTGAHYPSA